MLEEAFGGPKLAIRAPTVVAHKCKFITLIASTLGASVVVGPPTAGVQVQPPVVHVTRFAVVVVAVTIRAAIVRVQRGGNGIGLVVLRLAMLEYGFRAFR